MQSTCDLCLSLNVLADIRGDKFEAGVTGREAHFGQGEISDKAGLSRAALGSELRRELLSPSETGFFFLKLNDGRKPLPLRFLEKSPGLGGT